MTSLIVELDTNTQLEALKKYIQELGAKFRVLKNEDGTEFLNTSEELKLYSQALRNHSSQVLTDFVKNEKESMF